MNTQSLTPVTQSKIDLNVMKIIHATFEVAVDQAWALEDGTTHEEQLRKHGQKKFEEALRAEGFLPNLGEVSIDVFNFTFRQIGTTISAYVQASCKFQA